MTYTKFRALLSDTQNYEDPEKYIAAHPETDEKITSALFGFRDGITVKKIRALSGMTQMKMSELFRIPKRNIENWEASTESGKDTGNPRYRKPSRTEPDYLDYLLLFSVLCDYAES